MKFANTALIITCCIGLLVLVLTVVQQQQANQVLAAQATASCENSNTARVSLNEWGQALDEFLLAAEQARRASGTRNDLAAAYKYAELQKRVKLLAYRDCDNDGESDVPQVSAANR